MARSLAPAARPQRSNAPDRMVTLRCGKCATLMSLPSHLVAEVLEGTCKQPVLCNGCGATWTPEAAKAVLPKPRKRDIECV